MPTTIESAWSIDTNILVYATDPSAPLAKQEIARQLIKRLTLNPKASLVGQVLSEFMSVVLRKNAMTRAQALEAVSLLSQAADVLGASQHTYAQAWKLAATHKYQVWDALIVAICAEHGIKTLYSEDAGSLKRPLGVHVINPFAEIDTP
jgi:predicted nucleic acid-binding protein